MRKAVFLLSAALIGCAASGRAAPPSDFSAAASTATADTAPVLVPAGGLDEAAAASMSVRNDPDLKAARLRAGVAEARLLEAGLLPDPRLSGSLGRSKYHAGYSVGLSADVRPFFARGAARSVASAAAEETMLEILWSEWRTAEKARELFIQARADVELESVLSGTRDLLSAQYQLDLAAYQKDVSALAAVSADLAVLSEAESALRGARLDAERTRHELNFLLGLAPDARPVLTGKPSEKDLTQEEYRAALAAMPKRRFDLLALRAGCDSGDKALRLAALERFPPLTLSLQKTRSSEEGVDTVGVGLEVGLPLFDGNRGKVAVASATRDELLAVYQARLARAVSQADAARQAVLLTEDQLRGLDSRLSEMSQAADAAGQRFRAGVLGAGVYVGLMKSLLSGRAEAVRLRASLAVSRVVLAAILGPPPVTPVAAPSPPRGKTPGDSPAAN